MKLKSETIEIDGEMFEARELPIRALLPMMGRLQDDKDGLAQLELIGVSIHKDGAPILSGAGDVGAATYMKFQAAVLRVNGMSGQVGNG